MDKSIIFIEKAHRVHSNKYEYTFTKYTNQLTQVTITCPKHGNFVQTPKSHLRGHGCSTCAKEALIVTNSSTPEMFVKKANLVHANKYTYANVKYKNTRTKVAITCTIHGDFYQKPQEHLHGNGCPQCGRIASAAKQLKDTPTFILQANQVHNHAYAYSKTVYSGAFEKITITCKTHGDFEQRASDHLQGSRCPKCAGTNNWSYTAWERAGNSSKAFTGFKLYVLELWDNEECFIKVGKTFQDISARYRAKLPYEWRIIKVVEGSAKYISELETTIIQSITTYTPSVPFPGTTECAPKSCLDIVLNCLS